MASQTVLSDTPAAVKTERRTGVSRIAAAIVLACVPLCSAAVFAEEPTAQHTAVDDGVAFFQREIEPIFQQHCYACHSHASGKAKGGLVLDSRQGWEKGGSEGAAIVPGKPDESLLVAALRYESYEMPPDQPLKEQDIAAVVQWIAMGAPDPRQSHAPIVDPQKLWALEPITTPDVPAVTDNAWSSEPIDHFILAKLESQGLAPARDADRYTWLRRVTLDLTGLPPTPTEIAAFVGDDAQDAYEKVVDRLLASPGFGDHWARHWFDLSCYADLSDIQGDVLIRDAWRYRDYVIQAFNSDKPLDQFIHEQIAGDLLPFDSNEQRREQIIATGYLAIGPWTLQNYIKGQLDADVVDHQIDRIGKTFLGQTIGCARCHDHKFDPIPTADYYALAGIFHSTRTTSYDGPGVWSVINHVTLPQPDSSTEQRARDQQELAELSAQRRHVYAALTTELMNIPGGTDANVLTLQEPIEANREGTEYELRFQAGPSVWSATPQRTLAADGLQIDLIRADGSVLTGFRYDPGPWSGTRDAQVLKEAAFTYQGDGSGAIRIRITSATPGSSRFAGAIDDIRLTQVGEICDATSDARPTSVLFAEDFDAIERHAIEGAQADTALRVFAQAVVPGWIGGGINHSHVVDLGDGDYAVQFFGGQAQGLASAKPVTEAEQQAFAKATTFKQQLDRLNSKIAEIEARGAPEQAIAVCDVDQPADSPIYKRGDFQSLGAVVPRGFIEAVPTSTSYPIPHETSGRLQLAQWLTDANAPLTSRVLVNRVWHHIFGQGLVRTVDYFGVHGESPSHPELLDFLASRLREEDRWSLKKTIRHMVLSRTYRMSSAYNATAAAIDPDNRWLWQMRRRRLSAESIRDTMLFISGQLDAGRGGPCLGLELEGNIVGAGGNVNPPTWGGIVPENIKNRRTVYLPFKRVRPQGELEVLSIFDFPHPNDVTGARPNTTVATQALFLLNSPFVKLQAQMLAARLQSEEPTDERARIDRLFLLALSRPAQHDDIITSLDFLDQCTTQLDGNRNAAWSELCHAMLGTNGFLFRE